MKIKAFFLFPETDEDFIRIGDNSKEYENLIHDVLTIKSQLKVKADFELVYDSSNIDLFLRKANQIVGGTYLSKPGMQLRTLFAKQSRNTSKQFLRKNGCIYANWNIDYSKITNAHSLAAELAESKKLDNKFEQTILLNIATAFPTDRNSIIIIKDAIHDSELPNLISIPIANGEHEFSEWLIDITQGGFSLENKKVFMRTTFKWIKQTIYRHIKTGNYWYFDFFHKDNKRHFEVFDNQGNHLGEASENGDLIPQTRSDNKRIDFIIN